MRSTRSGSGSAVAVVLPLLFALGPLAAQGWVQVQQQGPMWPRLSACLVYDSQRQVTLMYGGAPWHVGAAAFDDTWQWNGTTWTQLQPATMPPWGEGARMAYDSVRGRAVRFGGWYQMGDIDQTWEFDGVDWIHRTPATVPAARRHQAMAFDSLRGRTVMFGGLGLADTWEWDGVDWLLRNPAVSPPAGGYQMVFDTARGRCVMVGGAAGQVWEWDGSNWSQTLPAVAPPDRYGMAVAFDGVRNRTLLFGGYTNTALNDTWEWDGAAWTQCPSPLVPSPRFGAAMAFDSGRGVVVLFAGDGITSGLSDTWEWHGPGPSFPSTWTPLGQGCAGSQGMPTLAVESGLPQLGTTLRLIATNLALDHVTTMWLGFSDTQWSGNALPFPLASLGMPGCTLYASSDGVFWLLNWNGEARWSIAIPNDTRLLGVRFFNQAGVVDRVNALGLVVTNAGAAVIGQ